MHIPPGGGPPSRNKRPGRLKVDTRTHSGGKQGKSPGGKSSGASTPRSAKSSNSPFSPQAPASSSPLTPMEPIVAPVARKAPEIPGEPVSNRRTSFLLSSDARTRAAQLYGTRSSADVIMSMDLEWQKNKGVYAAKLPAMPQVATPTRMGAPDEGDATSFDALLRKVEFRPGEQSLVETETTQPYRYAISTLLTKTLNSDGIELITLDSTAPQSYWAKVISLNADGSIPAAVRTEFDLMFKSMSPLRPRVVLQTQDKLYVGMPECFGNGLDLYRMISTIAEANGNDFTAALPVLRNTMDSLLQELADLHDLNIYHRDIKPENFLFSDIGQTALTDFGSAHEGRAMFEPASTPAYCAPNMFDGRPIDAAKTDVFALGASLMVLYSGQMPMLHQELSAWQAASDDLRSAESDLQGYRQRQTDETLKDESIDDKRARLDDAQTSFVRAVTEYKQAHAKMVQYLELRAAGQDDEPLPVLGRPAWTRAFASLVERDIAVAPILVGMMAPTNKHRLSAQEAYKIFSREGLKPEEATEDALKGLYKEQCADLLKRAQDRINELVASLHKSFQASSPLFDEPQLENQPTVKSLQEAKEHILRMGADVYHSIEEVMPGVVQQKDYENLVHARQDRAHRRTLNEQELEEIKQQVRDATPPKIPVVSAVRGVKRIRDMFIKVR